MKHLLLLFALLEQFLYPVHKAFLSFVFPVGGGGVKLPQQVLLLVVQAFRNLHLHLQDQVSLTA